MKNNSTVLVTGATGFTGRHLVQTLCQQNINVRAIARHTSSMQGLEDLPIEWIRGDVYDEQIIQQACQDVDYIFHVAAAYREAKISDDIYWKVHVQSTQLLAKYASQQTNFKRFVHISTVGVHGHTENPPVDETYRFSPGDEYQNTKVEAELWLKEFAQTNALPITIIRPAAIYGPGDRRLLKLFKIAKLPIIPILGFGCKGLYHLIHVKDLVNFMIVCADKQSTLDQIYICASETATSIKGLLEAIAQQLNKSPIFIRLPVTPVFILARLCELVCKPLNIEPPLYRRRVAFFTKDRSFNTQKMQNDTGFKCEYSNQKGVEELTKWYQSQGWL